MKLFNSISISDKLVNISACLLSLFLVISAILMEKFLGLKPCALCIVQRVIFLLLSLIFFVTFLIYNYKKCYLFLHIITSLSALSGIILAVRQSYLQLYPNPFATCGISFEYIINNFPILDVIEHVINGSGDCQEVQWTFIGLSLPMWGALFFLLFFLVSLYLIKNKIQNKTISQQIIL